MGTVSFTCEMLPPMSSISFEPLLRHGSRSRLTIPVRAVLERHFSSQSQTAFTVLALWLFAFTMRSVYVRLTQLHDVPGPFWAKYTRLWMSKASGSGRLHEVYHDTSRRYGPLVRIGPNTVLLSDPEETMRILSSRSLYERGSWYDAFKIEPDRANIVSERQRQIHLRMRYQMAPGYNGTDIASFESTIDSRIQDLMCRISTSWSSPPGSTITFDLGRWLRHLAMDIITHVAFGYPLGFMENDRDVLNFTCVMERLLPIVLQFTIFTEVNELLKALGKFRLLNRFLFPHHSQQNGVGKVRAVTKQVIASRAPPTPDFKTDMLDSFLRRGLSPVEAEAEMAIALVAGSDTISTTLRATILCIISNAPVYHKLQQDLDKAIAAGLVSFPIRYTEALRLPYLQACIAEGLRWHPPLVLPRERVVPPQGDTVCGYKLPGGTLVGLNSYTCQRHPIFGPDPEVFRPERWIEASEEQAKAMRKVWELIFGHGTTKCLGQNIALMTMNKMIPELLRRFDVSAIDPQRPWRSECYGIFFQKDFNVRITRRESPGCAA